MIVTHSLAAFETELEATILQQTAAVDAFLARRAATVAPPLSRQAAGPLGPASSLSRGEADGAVASTVSSRALRALYAQDMAAGASWMRARADPQPSSSDGAGSNDAASGSADDAAARSAAATDGGAAAIDRSIFELPESPISFQEAIGGGALVVGPTAPPRRAPRRPRSVALPGVPPQLQGVSLEAAKRARLESFLEEDLRQFLELRRRAEAEEASASGSDADATATVPSCAPDTIAAAPAAAAAVAGPSAPVAADIQQQQQQQQQKPPVFESDEALAAQKAAAREAMVALGGGGDSSAEQHSLPGKKGEAEAGLQEPGPSSSSLGLLGEVPARPRPFAARYAAPQQQEHAAAAAASLAGAAPHAAVPAVPCGQVVWLLTVGLVACTALQSLLPLQSAWAGSSLAFAPKGRLLSRLHHHPWAVAAMPAALLVALLPGLLRGRAMQFVDRSTEARYLTWANRRHTGRDLVAHAAWLLTAAALLLQARSGGAAAAWLLPPANSSGGWGDAEAAAAALTPLALLGPAVPAALSAALRGRWYVAHRETVLVIARLTQAAAALALRALAPARIAGAWPLLAIAQLSCALLMRVRFSVFLPSQLAHVLVSVCAGGACSTGAGAALHVSRLVGFGWCVPALLVFALEAHSRRAFAQRAWAQRRGGKGAAGAAASTTLPATVKG